MTLLHYIIKALRRTNKLPVRAVVTLRLKLSIMNSFITRLRHLVIVRTLS